MASIDITEFPIVFLNIDPNGDEHRLNEDNQVLETLLRRNQNFILINEGKSPDKDTPRNKESTKQMNQWMKKNKPELGAYVKAMIQIESSKTKRLMFKSFRTMFQKYWGFPLLVADTRDEAIRMGHELLATEDIRSEYKESLDL